MRDDAAPSPSLGLRSVLLVSASDGEVAAWSAQGYAITTLDVEPRTKPDILASMTDMGDIGPFDVVFCAHALEHLYPHEVLPALNEFRRVLRTGGAGVVVVPDLEGIPATDDLLPGVPCMTGLHMMYGDASKIAEFPHMAHHCGFVADTLLRAMQDAGFDASVSRKDGYQLMGVGIKR